MIQQKGYSVARHVVPSVLWTDDDSPKGLQLPHVDFDKVGSIHNVLSQKSKRPLSCIFPIDEPMFIQIWPTGPGLSTVVCLKVGDAMFFEPTLIHGGGVGGTRVHCYIAENIADADSYTIIMPGGMDIYRFGMNVHY